MFFNIGKVKYESAKYPIHTHAYYEILCFTCGEGWLKIGEETLDVVGGDIVVVPPNCLHGGASKDKLQSIYMTADVGVFNFSTPLVVKDNDYGEGVFLANAIFNNRYNGGEYLDSLRKSLSEFILKNVTVQDNLSIAVGKIIKEILANYSNCDFDVNQSLKSSGYAPDYIRAHFKKVTGKTPTDFLGQVRINHAKQLIEIYGKAMPMGEVAVLCGFYDYVYFSRRFKQLTGKSPQNYKKKD